MNYQSNIMKTANRYTVITNPNRYGTMMLRGAQTNGTVYIVECADTTVETELERAEVGTDIGVEVERVGQRGNAWRATAVEAVSTSIQE